MQWKPEDVRRLVVTNRPLGLGGHGNVFLGRIRFLDGKWRRVAVKRFFPVLSSKTAEFFSKVITDLSRAGVRLPKMGMVCLPGGEWVQVSQLFCGISKPTVQDILKDTRVPGTKTTSERTEAVIELAKVANAGYRPTDDILESFKNPAKGAIPIDLDQLAEQLAVQEVYPVSIQQKEFLAARELFSMVRKIARLSGLPEKEKGIELKRLERLAIQTVTLGIKKHFRQLTRQNSP
jgi:hypothetical protein